eukprot:391535_1
MVCHIPALNSNALNLNILWFCVFSMFFVLFYISDSCYYIPNCRSIFNLKSTACCILFPDQSLVVFVFFLTFSFIQSLKKMFFIAFYFLLLFLQLSKLLLLSLL